MEKRRHCRWANRDPWPGRYEGLHARYQSDSSGGHEWARFYLGSNWSAYITLGLDHKLIRTGPYAIVRHPIYSGFMIALVGSVLNFGHLRSCVAAAMVILAWIYKARLEETFMKKHFGTDYAQY